MNKTANLPIGVFDSGLGGLTVLKFLEKKLPNESFIYFGDTGRVPYGNKSCETIIKYSKEIVEFLKNKGVKIIIVACNTSSALALNALKNNFNLPLFGMINPAVEMVENHQKKGAVAVLGTNATIRSNIYLNKFSKLNSQNKIISKACPLFVPIIEEGLLEGVFVEEMIHHYLSNIKNKNLKQVILGCTHYPLLLNPIQNYLGKQVKLISSGEAVVGVVKNYLIKNNLFSVSKKNKTCFFVTDFPEKFQELGSQFLGRKLTNISYIRNF